MNSEVISEKKDQKKCAFFDVDGTLLNGYVIQNFPRYLADNGYIDTKYSKKIDEIINDYEKKNIQYKQAAETIAILYASALEGQHKNKINAWAMDFMEFYIPENILPYSKKLVWQIKKVVDLTIAVSGSPFEPIEKIQVLGFDQVYGSLIEIENGIYTGKVATNLILGEEKAKTAKNISKKFNVDLSRSVAFGDTDQDAFLFRMVGLPLAVNPNNKFRQICNSNNWLILENGDLRDPKMITKLIKNL